jgi:MFS family permease
MAIVVPAIVLRLAPRDHIAIFAVLATLVGVAVAVVPPIAGALSDRARRRGGDRRRETAVALAVDVVALAAMAFSASVGELGAALVTATIALMAAQTIYQVLLPEVVPRHAWGAAAGVRGAMTLVGTVLGLLAAALLPPVRALFAMGVAVALAATSLAAIPRAAPSAPPPSHAIVRDRHDLGVTLVARGWIVLGMTLLNTYVLYFFTDVLGVHDATRGTGMVAGAALLGAIVSSLLAGRFSDKLDRRIVVALSGVPMTLAALGFALLPDPHWIFAYAALFGLGFGGVFSVGYALALDAIPAMGDVARDLGVWGTLSSLPAIAAPGIGGWIIAHGATPAIGYRWLFAAAGASFTIGSLTVLRVGRKSVVPFLQTFLVGLAAVIRQPLFALRMRVRQWGRLPMYHRRTVLVANHQHEDESELLVERAYAQSFGRTLYTASTRRMYEPGFFALRMPWLGFMRGVNAGPLFLAMGMLPLENELSSRPLRSLAQAVHAQHGDLALELVFRPEALTIAPAGATKLSDLLAPAFFVAGDTRVRLSYVREPYRKELLVALRAGVDEDIARIVDVVQRGASFFVTPEGFYSVDGRMRPLKGIVEHLVPIADVWLAAIAFDPFRGRRLSILYRVLPYDRSAALATALAAARPFTTSALLAAWLLAVDLPFDTLEAIDGVVRLRDGLPRGAFVDPELMREPERCVREALDVMAERDLLHGDGTRYALGTRGGDHRFAGVTDVVAYQATFYAETIAALQSTSAAPSTSADKG